MEIDYAEYKSRNKKISKFKTGHTYRVYHHGEDRLINLYGAFEEKLTGEVANSYLLEHGLTTFEEKSDSTMNRYFNGKYSMNKKKRWLLPSLLKQAFETEVKYEKSDDTSKDSLQNKAIVVTCDVIKSGQIFEFVDNHGFQLSGSYYNTGSVWSQLNHHDDDDEDSMVPGKSKKRAVFKRGNRRFNRTNLRKKNDIKIKHDPFYDDIHHKFEFTYAKKTLRGSKSFRSGTKRFRMQNNPDDKYTDGRQSWEVNDFKYFKFGYHLLNKIIKEAVEPITDNQMIDIVDVEPIDLSTRVNLADVIEQKRLTRMPKFRQEIEMDLEPRKIIYIDEEEIIFHDRALKRLIDEKSNEPVIQQTQTTTQPVSHAITVFERFKLLVDDLARFSSSVTSFVSSNEAHCFICYDASPVKLHIDLCRFSYHLTELARGHVFSARLIYDLPCSDQVLLNINYSNPKQTLNTQEFVAQLALEPVSTMSELVDSVSNNLYNILCNEVVKPRHQRVINESDSLDISKLFQHFEQKLRHLIQPQQGSSRIDTSSRSIETCEICYNELSYPDDFFSLKSCGHSACLDCWRSYLLNKISNMKVTTSFAKDNSKGSVKVITCLHDKCDKPVRLDLFYSLIEIDYIRKYVQYYTDLQIIRNSDKYIYCKSVKCGRVICIDGDRESKSPARWYDQFVRGCECGYQVCRFCRDQVHYPALCKQAKLYMEDMKKLEEAQVDNIGSLYVSEGKNCPRCGSYMEKNAGCNHMSCPCGFQFCWLCLKDFYMYHTASNGYYCKYAKVNETVYDSSTFINFATKLKNLRRSLSDIMFKQRMFRANVATQGKITHSLVRLSHSASLTVHKCLSSSQSSDLKLIHYLGLDASDTSLSKLTQRLSVFFLTEIPDNFHWLNLVIEYLALLLSCPSKVFKLSAISYSYKSNLYHSLKKALYLKEKMHEILVTTLEPTMSFKKTHLNRIVFFNSRIVSFLANINHLTMKSLRLYEKFDPNQLDQLQV